MALSARWGARRRRRRVWTTSEEEAEDDDVEVEGMEPGSDLTMTAEEEEEEEESVVLPPAVAAVLGGAESRVSRDITSIWKEKRKEN